MSTVLKSVLGLLSLFLLSPFSLQAQESYFPSSFAYAILSLFALPTAIVIFLILFFVLKAFESWSKKMFWPLVMLSIFLGYAIAFYQIVP